MSEFNRRIACAYASGVYAQMTELIKEPKEHEKREEQLAVFAVRAKAAAEREYDLQIKCECNEYGSWSFS